MLLPASDSMSLQTCVVDLGDKTTSLLLQVTVGNIMAAVVISNSSSPSEISDVTGKKSGDVMSSGKYISLSPFILMTKPNCSPAPSVSV